MVVEGEFDDLITMLSSCWMRIFLLSSWCLLNKLNENRSEKLLITLWLGENSEWRGIKEGKILLNLLSMFTKWSLIREHWWLVSESSEDECCTEDEPRDNSMSDQMRWLGGSECTRSCDLPPSFWRWSLMGINPAMALIPNYKEVLKAPKIHRAALLCIFPNIFRWYIRGAWL